jgi:hypothetical protein
VDGPGYSGTPLARKLGVKTGHVVHLVDAPRGWSVPGLPEGATVQRKRSGSTARGPVPDVVVSFHRSAADLAEVATEHARRLAPTSALWIAWPRRAGGHHSDVTESLVRATLLPVGVVDVKVAALDDDWSGLRFVWRRVNRPPTTVMG